MHILNRRQAGQVGPVPVELHIVTSGDLHSVAVRQGESSIRVTHWDRSLERTREVAKALASTIELHAAL